MNTKLITIPNNVTMNITILNSKINPELTYQKLAIVGPLGKKTMVLPFGFSIEINKKSPSSIILNLKAEVTPSKINKEFGVFTSQIQKMIQGVTTGFTKQVKLFGIGYKFHIENNSKLFMSIGFSNPVEITKIPSSVSVKQILKNDPSLLEVFSTSLTDLNNFVYGLQKIRPVYKSFKGTGVSVLNN